MLEDQKSAVVEELHQFPPNDAQQVQTESAAEKSPKEKLGKIEFTYCKEVAYEMLDGMPGLRYKEEDGHQ